jgi:putative SOS response-associated peptidase YedK
MEQQFPDIRAIPQLAPRYNIAAVQPVVTVLNMKPRHMDITQWGLIPSWAEDPTRGFRMINIFADKFRDKPVFARLLRRKRCVVFADGYYAWRTVRNQKATQPMYVRLKSGKAFAFAAIFDEWHDGEGGYIITSGIITTRPNVLVRTIDQTMPVILRDADLTTWLNPHFDKIEVLQHLLVPYAPEAMELYPVSHHVDRVRNDDAKCIEPLGAGPAQQQELF